MGAKGAIIMGFFGAVFAALTLYWQWHVAGPWLAAPFLVFAAIAAAAIGVLRLPGSGVVLSRSAGRAVMWSSIGEGLGLFVGSQIVLNLHRPDLLPPVMALVVGLHFFPIGRASGFRGYYVLGGALVAAAAIGFVVAGPTGGALAGLSAAAALWIAAILAILRDRRARVSAPASRR